MKKTGQRDDDNNNNNNKTECKTKKKEKEKEKEKENEYVDILASICNCFGISLTDDKTQNGTNEKNKKSIKTTHQVNNSNKNDGKFKRSRNSHNNKTTQLKIISAGNGKDKKK